MSNDIPRIKLDILRKAVAIYAVGQTAEVNIEVESLYIIDNPDSPNYTMRGASIQFAVLVWSELQRKWVQVCSDKIVGKSTAPYYRPVSLTHPDVKAPDADQPWDVVVVWRKSKL